MGGGWVAMGGAGVGVLDRERGVRMERASHGRMEHNALSNMTILEFG